LKFIYNSTMVVTMAKKMKINLTSIVDNEETILQTEAILEKLDDTIICSYVDNRDNQHVDVKMVLTKDEAVITRINGKDINKSYFKKGHTYVGKQYFSDYVMNLKIETIDYRFDKMKIFIKYRTYLNDTCVGNFEHFLEFKERENNEC